MGYTAYNFPSNGEEAVDQRKLDFNAIWERHGMSYAKEIVLISSAV